MLVSVSVSVFVFVCLRRGPFNVFQGGLEMRDNATIASSICLGNFPYKIRSHYIDMGCCSFCWPLFFNFTLIKSVLYYKRRIVCRVEADVGFCGGFGAEGRRNKQQLEREIKQCNLYKVIALQCVPHIYVPLVALSKRRNTVSSSFDTSSSSWHSNGIDDGGGNAIHSPIAPPSHTAIPLILYI